MVHFCDIFVSCNPLQQWRYQLSTPGHILWPAHKGTKWVLVEKSPPKAFCCRLSCHKRWYLGCSWRKLHSNSGEYVSDGTPPVRIKYLQEVRIADEGMVQAGYYFKCVILEAGFVLDTVLTLSLLASNFILLYSLTVASHIYAETLSPVAQSSVFKCRILIAFK